MEVMRAAERIELAGGDVLHLEVGQPATAAPQGVRDAAAHALATHPLGYTTPLGLPALREAISTHYGDWYDRDVDPDRIVITAGASGACVLAFLALFNPGDRVVVPSPGYPCYRNMLSAFGVKVVDLLVDESTRFQPTPALLAELGPIDGLVVASPSNPTGTMIHAAEMNDLTAWCDANGVRLISDEIYHGISYGTTAPTAAAYSDHSIIVQSFSKYFSMTGWRLGWMIIPTDMREAFVRLAANLFISPPTLSQIAAVAAFDCHDELTANIARYGENRRILLDGLRAAGFERLAPADGAFYVYAHTGHLSDNSQALTASWLADIGVAATSGVDFDPQRGHESVRFSFAGAPADMSEAVRRIGDWVATEGEDGAAS